MSTLLERRRRQHFRNKLAAQPCELCGKPLGEESVSASDGTNEPVRIHVECPTGDELRPHLEELYALRLFYDHLYPQQPAENTKEVLARQIEREKQELQLRCTTESECGQQPATDVLEQARITHYELSTGERG